MVVSRNYCSYNGGNLYRAPYCNGNPNIGPRIIVNLDQYPYEVGCKVLGLRFACIVAYFSYEARSMIVLGECM